MVLEDFGDFINSQSRRAILEPYPLRGEPCIGSPSSPHPVSEAAVDTGSEITTTDLQEKEVVEPAENGRDAAAIGNAKEENGEQEADNEVDEQEEEGGEEEKEEEEGDAEEEDGDEDEEAESATGQRAAEDDEDDDVDTKQQKTHGDDQTAEKEKLNYKKKKAAVTCSPSTSGLRI
ncbi:PREDICTED: prothymosin alpha-like [Cercocebus atys]|uniref:prothymosin alpha-like n=1 Tax=Cercocebus atys TaxID=9531 RepID=UPI0005F37000|nr:PREDICTED: prothymosin alpha-like [Cercocebus atys]